ncbi:MAG: hypothetical protein LW720_01490 [Pirellula sp.]|jgi:hypothetical protein|nr:hypothetical protein [Pirellula sp.]
MTTSSTESRQDPGGDASDSDIVFQLTPDYHIQERLDREKFIEFVESAFAIITECCNDPPPTLAELQVGCAVLPGNRLVVEVQTGPAEVRSLHAKDITSRLRRLMVPSVEGGPVAFARQIRFYQAAEGRSLTFPFASFVHSEQPTTLDEVLLEAGAVRLPSPSLLEKVRAFFIGKRQTRPVDTESEPIAAALSRRTRVNVIVGPGQLVLDRARQDPFTIVEDKLASEGFALVKYASGANGAVDKLTVDYVRSQMPQPTQTAFDGLLARVARVRVLEGGMADGRPLGNAVLLDTAGESDLAELKQSLAILDGPAGHCLCCGGPTLEFLSSQSESLAALGIHHGLSVRWAAWKDDAELLDGRRLLDWLAQRGVPSPLAEFLDQQRREEQRRADWQRWLAAMPDCLKQLPPGAWQHVTETSDLTAMQESLSAAYPNLRTRILALFRWFGNGAGPWTGFPVYEQLAEQILLQLPMNEVIGVLQTVSPAEEELEGAARFFAGWAFTNRTSAQGVKLPPSLTDSNLAAFLPERSVEPASIPASLRRELLAHCRKSSDEDKKQRAESAFAE